jgi:hypothetical protein
MVSEKADSVTHCGKWWQIAELFFLHGEYFTRVTVLDMTGHATSKI